jgi:bifunctional non-homologous end joining protein LigD
LWDWGTWDLSEGDAPVQAVARGGLHFDLHGSKLAGRFALVRRGRQGDREQWLLIHKHDDSAVLGWDPEDHPRSVKSGRTNDEVKSAPAATWSSNARWVGPTAAESAALAALPTSGGRWKLGDHTLRLTVLDKVLIPAARRHRAVTKRDLIHHYAFMAPAMLPYLYDRPVTLPYPGGLDKI